MILNITDQKIAKKKKSVLIHLIAAARPNFMKIAPLFHALSKEEWATPIIVHTGQHYDVNMSDTFFTDLNIPNPNLHLGIGGGTHAEQTGQVMIKYEKVLNEVRPDLVVVVGDVNSTMAVTIAAVKLGVKVAHLEGGLRSFDRSMPEEINRVVTDALADILWTPSPDADENLIHEGIAKTKIHRVGNIMIDSLEMLRNNIEGQKKYREYNLEPEEFGIITIHRPSNVDNPEILREICKAIINATQMIPLIFPIHPRTRKSLKQNALMPLLYAIKGLFLTEPLSYLSFMNLLFNCRLIITDSGGIQEEASYLGIPCLTLRANTERPITITHGTNQLCRLEDIPKKVRYILSDKTKKTCKIEFWDGNTASRVVQSIKKMLI